MATSFTFITPESARLRTTKSLEDIVGQVMYRINTAIQQESHKGNFSTVFDFRTVDLGNDQQEAVDRIKTDIAELGYSVELVRQFQAGSKIFEQVAIEWTPVEPDPDPAVDPEPDPDPEVDPEPEPEVDPDPDPEP